MRFLCVLDFEATCWTEGRRGDMEIIEFPSILYRISDSGKPELLGEFHEYVRPVRFPDLSSFCTELTGITQSTVDCADVLQNVYARHFAWLVSLVKSGNTGEKWEDLHNVCFVTCGHWDFRTMWPIEVQQKGLCNHIAYSRYINLKDAFSTFYGRKCGSMVDMLTKLRIPLTGRHHSGIDDTRSM